MDKHFLTVLLAALLILAPGLKDKQFSTRGEAREALVAQSIVDSGNWILPRGYNGDIPSKPPLLHWLSAILSLPAGEVNEVTARLPSALAALLFVLFFYVIVRRDAGEGTALISSLMLMTTAEWARASVGSRVDMLLTALFCAGLFTLYRWEVLGRKGIPFISILLLGGATLTKGPVSIVLPASIFGAFLLVRGRGFIAATLDCLKIFLPVLLISLIWYVAAYLQDPKAFGDKVYYENVARFLGTMEDEPHKHSIFYLYGSLLAGWLPWTLVLLPGVIAARPHTRPTLASVRLWFMTQRTLRQFCWIAIILILIFFSIPASKRSVYLLPLYPFAALLLAEHMAQHIVRYEAWARRISIGFFALVALLVSAIAAIGASPALGAAIARRQPSLLALIQRSIHFAAASWFDISVYLLIPCLALFGLYRAKLRVHRDARILCAIALIVSLVASLEGLATPFTNALSPKEFSRSREIALALPAAEKEIFSYHNELYALSFYLHRRIYRYDETLLHTGALVFVFDSDLEKLRHEVPKQFSLRVLERSTYPITKQNSYLYALRLDPARS